MPPKIDPCASIGRPPPSATTRGSCRMPLCGCPGWLRRSSSLVLVRKLTAVQALPAAGRGVPPPGGAVSGVSTRIVVVASWACEADASAAAASKVQMRCAFMMVSDSDAPASNAISTPILPGRIARMSSSAPVPRDSRFLEDMDRQLVGWDDPVARLRRALERNELVAYAQPVMALRGSEPIAFAEVLVRLRGEERALLPPGEFLPVFEHFRMMREL